MKSLLVRLTVLLALLAVNFTAASASNKLFLESNRLIPGSSTELVFSLDNEGEFVGFQTEIHLPEGISFEGESDTEMIHLQLRIDNSFMLFTNRISESILRLMVVSENHEAIQGNSGALFSIDVTVADSFRGGDLELTNTIFSDKDDKDTVFEDYSCFINYAIPVDSIVIEPENPELRVGETILLSVTLSPANTTETTVVWNSSDESVATVDSDGKVTAVSLGEATITATSGSVSATCKVTVVATPVESITLSAATWSGKVGDSVTLTATVLPEDATDKTVTWTTSHPEIATVDSEGKVTAVALGEATITATSASVSATCTVTVVATPVESITLSATTWSGKVGDSFTLTATVLPEDATDKTVTWTTSDPEIAMVDSEGKVTAVSLGEATITATSGSVSATCTVTVVATPVESIALDPTEWSGEEGTTFRITATILPDDATDKRLSWTSSDTSIAIVNEEGVVEVLKVGNCVITASALDGSDLSAQCRVTGFSDLDELQLDDDTRWDVYNMSGRLLIKDCESADLKRLETGVYILHDGRKAVKLVIR